MVLLLRGRRVLSVCLCACAWCVHARVPCHRHSLPETTQTIMIDHDQNEGTGLIHSASRSPGKMSDRCRELLRAHATKVDKGMYLLSNIKLSQCVT